MHTGVYVRSIYFQDPDGILLEFACWQRNFAPTDVSHAPVRADGTSGEVPIPPEAPISIPSPA
jgi:hypothetical protein